MTIEDLMNMEVSESFDDTPVPVGNYDVVLTSVTVGNGPKGPYLKVEATIHDEEFRGRKVWRNAVSFSEKALGMPGGIAQLMQATKVDISKSAEFKNLPGLLANALSSVPVTIEVGHEQAGDKSGNLRFETDGTPIMRATIANFIAPAQEFVDSLEAEAAGLDDDLPF